MCLCCLAKPAILLHQQTLSNAPSSLPAHVIIVLAKALGHNVEVIQDSWSAFKDFVWDHDVITPSGNEIELFNVCGLNEGLGDPFPLLFLASLMNLIHAFCQHTKTFTLRCACVNSLGVPTSAKAMILLC